MLEGSQKGKWSMTSKLNILDRNKQEMGTETRKQKWSNNSQFIAVLINYTLGLQAARKGTAFILKTPVRGANLIIFPALTIFVATPIIFMQLVLGQYSGKTTIKVWDMCPILRGVGIVHFINFAVYQMYNQMWTTYSLFYSLVPFMVENDWSTCNKTWAAINCYTTNSNYSQRIYCYKKLSFEECNAMEWYSSTQMYFLFHVLNVDRTTWHFGPLNLKLMPYGLATTALVYLANFNGVRTLEIYLTVLFFVPFVMATTMLFFTLLHPGSLIGLRAVLDMKFDEIFGLTFWTQNIASTMYISGVSFGNHIVFGSQCNFRNSLHFKAIITIAAECMFLFLYSLLIMIMMGIICYESNKNEPWMILRRAETNMFATLPEAVEHLKGPPMFWIFYYYVFVFLLGYRSQVVMVCNNLEVVYDMYPGLRRHNRTCIFLWCVFLFVGSLIFYSRVGHVYLRIIEKYWFINNLPFLCAVQSFGVVYIYGVNRFLDDASFMLGLKAPGYFRIAYIVSPIVFFTTYVYRVGLFFGHAAKPDHRLVSAPKYLWYFRGFCFWNNVVVIFVYFMYHLFKYFVFKKGRNPFLPTPDWGPCEKHLTKSRQMFTAHSMTKEYIYRQERFKKRFITDS